MVKFPFDWKKVVQMEIRMITVVNARGTAEQDAPGGGSWLDFWHRNKPGRTALRCSNVNCTAMAEDGAHVVIQGQGILMQRLYIIPLCSQCNHPTQREPFVVSEGELVLID